MKVNELFPWLRGQDYKTVGDALDYTVTELHSDKADILMLCFQESNQRRDWVNNFRFPVELYKNQEGNFKVARGWAEAYKSGNDYVMEDYLNAIAKHPDWKRVVAGFSYGSAPSLFGAEDTWFHMGHTPVDGVFTYGSVKPLFGKKSKEHFMQCSRKFFQFAHANDIVGKCIPLPGYCRVDNTILGKDEQCFFKLFNPTKWHQIYGEAYLYEPLELNVDIEDLIQ